jgi:hypothetical protein
MITAAVPGIFYKLTTTEYEQKGAQTSSRVSLENDKDLVTVLMFGKTAGLAIKSLRKFYFGHFK